jgi:hypothetical protein
MYKIEGAKPTPESSIEEIADYIECQSLLVDAKISINETVKPILMVSDEINVGGIDDDDAAFQNRIEEVIQEIDRRSQVCDQRYPFSIHDTGYTIQANKNDSNYWVYIFLLLSTRLNMNSRKILAEIDGSKILEYLSAEVAKCYFGCTSRIIGIRHGFGWGVRA